MLYNVQIISVNMTNKNSLAQQAKVKAASDGNDKTPRQSSPPISQMQVTP